MSGLLNSPAAPFSALIPRTYPIYLEVLPLLPHHQHPCWALLPNCKGSPLLWYKPHQSEGRVSDPPATWTTPLLGTCFPKSHCTAKALPPDHPLLALSAS